MHGNTVSEYRNEPRFVLRAGRPDEQGTADRILQKHLGHGYIER